ncbi:hypothetical protein LB504_010029 [Fusarium proliferatum]|nr:hypothetical protein LB504_010029 [Fusarium proliferatum]
MSLSCGVKTIAATSQTVVCHGGLIYPKPVLLHRALSWELFSALYLKHYVELQTGVLYRLSAPLLSSAAFFLSLILAPQLFTIHLHQFLYQAYTSLISSLPLYFFINEPFPNPIALPAIAEVRAREEKGLVWGL